jgi:hypothetical protein
MELDLANWLRLAVAFAAAGLMGFAIQRGGTCMVAAVSEVVSERRISRSVALGESALWVSGLLALAGLAGLMNGQHFSYTFGLAALTGGLLLGVGALANGACVFGTIARLGTGDWNYLLTPVGFFFGSLAHAMLSFPSEQAVSIQPDMRANWLIVALFGPLLVLRLVLFGREARRDGLAVSLWNMHNATLVIGVAFFVLALSAGPWTYPEALARAAHSGVLPLALDVVLSVALLLGAVAGGWRMQKLHGWNPSAAFACFGGGALMGIGSAMIPGGNDNLTLVGIPMRQAYAWMAIAAMALAIWAGLHVKARLRKLASDRGAGDLPVG